MLRLRFFPLSLLIVALSFAAAPSAQQPIPPALRPNVLLIVLDDVGREKLGFYDMGVPTPPTPYLDVLRQHGVLFQSAYVQPLCSPTRAAMLTGRYAYRTGMGNLTNDGYRLPLSEVTVPEVLRSGFPGPQHAYRSGIFGKWHLAPAPDYSHAIDSGFDVFQGAMGNVGNHYHWTQVTADSSGYTTDNVGSDEGPFDETTYTASVQTSAALQWIDAQPGPFFASMCFNAPHTPLQVPPLGLLSEATQAEILSLGYAPGQDLTDSPDKFRALDWIIEAVDHEIGRLLAGMSPRKLAKTLVIVISDNGTARGLVLDPLNDEHAKGTVYDLGTRVPLLVSGPLVEQQNSDAFGLVTATDVWSTIAEATGAAQPATGGEDSVSFLAMIRDPGSASLRSSAFVQIFTPNGPYEPDPQNPPPGLVLHDRALTDGHFKYIRKLVTGTDADYVEEAYDLLLDPEEAVDLWPDLQHLPKADRDAILALKSEMIESSGL
jgi:arylsulfatase A-like enzyme